MARWTWKWWSTSSTSCRRRSSPQPGMPGPPRLAGPASELAAAIKALRRPTASASLANLLVRRHREQVDKLTELGSAMRQAQAELAVGDLRRLSQQRQPVISALEAEVRRLATEQGHDVSAVTAEELRATLEAAIADPDAAEALSSGRLVGALRYSGFGPAESAPGLEVPVVAPTPRAGRNKAPGPHQPKVALHTPTTAADEKLRRRPGRRRRRRGQAARHQTAGLRGQGGA